MTMSQLLYLG